MLYCRQGFENDCAAEIQEKASQIDVFGFPRATANSGYVVFECYQSDDAKKLIKKIDFSSFIFARQFFASVPEVTDMPLDDRVSAVLNVITDFPLCGELRVETADTNEAKELSKFCKKFAVPLRQALRKNNKLTRTEQTNKPVMHIMFTANDRAFIGVSYSNNNSPYHMGIPRLKFPSKAPSRSTLKLDEAFNLFIRENTEQRLGAGLHAVDLGACPGGWTYQLVERGMRVAAIDNGAMDEYLMGTGLVTHYREDGFKFEPKASANYWLVCDMIEKPTRVAALMAQWLCNGWCQETIFNLKLPMKKRYETVQESIEIAKNLLKEYGIKYELQAKHLYHDREEITVHIRKLHITR